MKKLLVGTGIAVVVVAGILGFLIYNINVVVKNGIEVVAPEVLGVPVTIDKVRISFLNGSGAISGVSIGNPEGYKADHAMRVDEVRILLEPASLASDKIHIREMIIEAPSITYEGNLVDRILASCRKMRLPVFPNPGREPTSHSRHPFRSIISN